VSPEQRLEAVLAALRRKERRARVFELNTLTGASRVFDGVRRWPANGFLLRETTLEEAP
jgi:hypothetical protein